MIVIQIVMALSSTVCLICLSAYIFLANKRNSLTISTLVYGRGRNLSLNLKAFLVFSGIALFICFYQGAEAMLFWIPDDWGGMNEYGDYMPVRYSIASLFAGIGGAGFLYYLENAANATVRIRDIVEERDGYKLIVNAIESRNLWELRQFKTDCEKTIFEIDEELRLIRDDEKLIHHPKSIRRSSLKEMTRTIEALLVKFATTE